MIERFNSGLSFVTNGLSKINPYISNKYNELTKDSNLAKITIKVATYLVPTILLLSALSYLPKASAGPATYSSCVKGCMAMGNPVFIAGCVAACTATLGPWCP